MKNIQASSKYLANMCVRSLQLCPTLCDPIGCNLPGSSVSGISQREILEWVAMPFSGDFPNPGIEPASPESPALAGRYFTPEPSGKPYFMICLIVITLFTEDRVI